MHSGTASVCVRVGIVKSCTLLCKGCRISAERACSCLWSCSCFLPRKITGCVIGVCALVWWGCSAASERYIFCYNTHKNKVLLSICTLKKIIPPPRLKSTHIGRNPECLHKPCCYAPWSHFHRLWGANTWLCLFTEASTCTQTCFHASTQVLVKIPTNSLQLSKAGVFVFVFCFFYTSPKQNWWRSCGPVNKMEVASWRQRAQHSQDPQDWEEIAFRSCVERRQMVCLRWEGTHTPFVLEWKNADYTCCRVNPLCRTPRPCVCVYGNVLLRPGVVAYPDAYWKICL